MNMVEEDKTEEMNMVEEDKKVDTFCANDLFVGEERRNGKTRCVEFLNMKLRVRSRSVTLNLLKEYPDLGNLKTSKFRTLPIIVLGEWAVIRESNAKAKALEIIVQALRSNKSPVTGRTYTGHRTISIVEWNEIKRMAHGLEPTGVIVRSVRIYPSDREILEKVFKQGIAEARRTEPKEIVDRLEYFASRLLV